MAKCLLQKMFRPQALQRTSTSKKISCWQNFQLNLCEMEPMSLLEMGRQRGKYSIRNQAGVLLCRTVHSVFTSRQYKGEQECLIFTFLEMLYCQHMFLCTFVARLYFGLDYMQVFPGAALSQRCISQGNLLLGWLTVGSDG